MEKEPQVCPTCKEIYFYNSKKHRYSQGLCEACYDEVKSHKERDVKVTRRKKSKVAPDEKPS